MEYLCDYCKSWDKCHNTIFKPISEKKELGWNGCHWYVPKKCTEIASFTLTKDKERNFDERLRVIAKLNNGKCANCRYLVEFGSGNIGYAFDKEYSYEKICKLVDNGKIYCQLPNCHNGDKFHTKEKVSLWYEDNKNTGSRLKILGYSVPYACERCGSFVCRKNYEVNPNNPSQNWDIVVIPWKKPNLDTYDVPRYCNKCK